MTEAIWQTIRNDLEREIAQSRYQPGDKLPTETELASRFSVNRHTVRRALKDLEDQGVLHIRRGAGAFVAAPVLDYHLGQKTRFRTNLAQAGSSASGKILRLERLAADAREAEALGLPVGAPVILREGIGFADNIPLTYAQSTFPAECFPGLEDALRHHVSVSAALNAAGIPSYSRISTRISAEAASQTVARHLHCRTGTPLLRTVAINVDPSGRPLEYGRSYFRGDRIQLVVDAASFPADTPTEEQT